MGKKDNGHAEETKLCKPQRYVLFLKTHKTGGSTLHSILSRYADKHNLTVITPGEDKASFGFMVKFRLSYIAQHGLSPHFLINHARYSRKTMELVLPHDKTLYISVLRNPVTTWESAFNYMKLANHMNIAGKSDPMSYFLEHLPSTKMLRTLTSNPILNLLRNPMFFDLGLDAKYFENETMIRRAVNTIDKDFELILISEYMDESLTLLRRRFCWAVDDVVYFKTNERLDREKRKENLTEKQVETIKEWNNADMFLYNFFVQKLWKQIENEGASFQADVNELKRSRESHFKLCIEKSTSIKWYDDKFVKGFQLRNNLTGDTKQLCERMVKTEKEYIRYFRKKIEKQIRVAEWEDDKSLYHIP